MIDREDLTFLRNVLSLHNYDVDLEFLTTILNTTHNNPELSEDIFDSFSDNQYKAKGKLIHRLDGLGLLSPTTNVSIFGGWYGSILVPLLMDKVNSVDVYDVDEKVINLAKNNLFKDTEGVEFIHHDVFGELKSRIADTDLVINTSCEHMPPMKEWPHWKRKRVENIRHFALQSNNMFGIEGHINCVNSMEEFVNQMPDTLHVKHVEEIEDSRGIRYMIIGELDVRRSR